MSGRVVPVLNLWQLQTIDLTPSGNIPVGSSYIDNPGYPLPLLLTSRWVIIQMLTIRKLPDGILTAYIGTRSTRPCEELP